jgi:ferredoxin
VALDEVHALDDDAALLEEEAHLCEARAIAFPPRLGGCSLPQIDPARCTGCGACVAPCPTAAIEIA